jgi:hypothetical protein
VNSQPATLTKEQLQRQVKLPPVYTEALERAISDMMSPDDLEEALCSNYFRTEVVACESENALREDDTLQEDEYSLQAIWFLAGWQARQRMEAQNENIAKTISKANRR